MHTALKLVTAMLRSIAFASFALAATVPAILSAQHPAALVPDSTILAGYSPPSSQIERGWENRFAAVPSPDSLRRKMRLLTARPHHLGSPADSVNAQWILKRFQEYGFDARIERFDVLFPTPKIRQLELLAPTHFVARLQEPPILADPDSRNQVGALPPYNVYGADGNVTAPLVYVNYGVPADYEELARHGISVRGAIVIARYGGSWRGIKPKVAAEHGAVGCLIYSDPRDDGYAAGAVFPAGPMRPANGVQRGSVADLPTYPGDPLTPGIGATPGAHRLALSEAITLPRIPVQPISYADAQPLLAALGGPVVPDEWRGALPITYRFGPGRTRVHLHVTSDWSQHPLYDVIATIPGAVEPDQWVLRGNHHDAWVRGAEDPIAGLAAELEEARGLGMLLRQGWRPRRTIVYAAWDGEEPGLLGSTEWVETHADELRTKAVAYLNSDTNDRGYLRLEGSHVLEQFFNGVARDIVDPETGLSAWKRVQLLLTRSGTASQQHDAHERTDLRLGALGSGSDYSPFLQHLGIAALNIGYNGETSSGIYHSAYDDFYWYTHFSDSSFVYGRALAQTVGTAVLRLADAEVIPFAYGNLAETVHGYVGEVKRLADGQIGAAEQHNAQVNEGVFAATDDPREPSRPVGLDSIPPKLDFTLLEQASDTLTRSADRYTKALAAAQARHGGALPDDVARPLNALLLQSERVLTDSIGLPGRPWYQHQLYAPGYYTGYGVKTLPAVREAIEQKKFGEVAGQIRRLAGTLRAEAGLLDRATTLLEGAH